MGEKSSSGGLDIIVGRGVSLKNFQSDIRSQIVYNALVEVTDKAKITIQKILKDVTATLPHGRFGSHGPGHNGAVDLTQNIMRVVVTQNNKNEMAASINIELDHNLAQRRHVGDSKYGDTVDMLYAFNNGWYYPYRLYIPESFYNNVPDKYGSHKEAKLTRNYYPGDGFIAEAAYRIECAFARDNVVVTYDPKYTDPIH